MFWLIGEAASPRELEEVVEGVKDLPVFIGSGVTTQNMNQYKSATGNNANKIFNFQIEYQTFENTKTISS